MLAALLLSLGALLPAVAVIADGSTSGQLTSLWRPVEGVGRDGLNAAEATVERGGPKQEQDQEDQEHGVHQEQVKEDDEEEQVTEMLAADSRRRRLQLFDDCASSPCKNGATCLNASRVPGACSWVSGVAHCNASYHCECADGEKPTACEILLPPWLCVVSLPANLIKIAPSASTSNLRGTHIHACSRVLGYVVFPVRVHWANL